MNYVRNQFNYLATADGEVNTYSAEVNNDPYITVPDMTPSIPELLSRFARGQTVPTLEPIWHGDDIPDLTKLDSFQMIEYAQEIGATIQQLQQQLQYQQQQNKVDAIQTSDVQDKDANSFPADEL